MTIETDVSFRYDRERTVGGFNDRKDRAHTGAAANVGVMPKKGTKKVSTAYRVIYAVVHFLYPKTAARGIENLPDTPVVYVGNHAQTNGPLVAEFYMPRPRKTWCIGEMMDKNTVAEYAFRDFWSFKPRWQHWFWKIVARLITPLAVCLFNNAECIGVYHDARVMNTFRETIATLEEGKDVVIFPEENVKNNHIVYHFQDGFVSLAKLYKRRTGRDLPFVPMYVCPALHSVYFGKPVYADIKAPADAERARVCDVLSRAITEMAEALPEHTVVPYRNIGRRHYPKNTSGSGKIE